MSLPTPNYVLTEDVELSGSGQYGQEITLASGSFVRPIDYYYIPQSIRDKHPIFNPEFYSFCYTRYGIHMLRNSMFRRVP